MPNVQLAKPNNVPSGNIIVTTAASTAEIGDAGLTGTLNFYIKASQVRIRYTTQLASITGDGDLYPCWTHNGLLQAVVQIRGFMVASSAPSTPNDYTIGIVDLNAKTGDVDDNPIGEGENAPNSDYGLILALSVNRYHAFEYFLIDQINVQYSRSAPFVGIALRGRASETDPANMESLTVPT